MEEIFYHKGKRVFEKKLIDKIRRDSKRCYWHDEPDKNFTGYVGKDGHCYDVCSYGAWERVKKRQEEEQNYINEFKQIKNRVIQTIENIENFLESLDEITSIKNRIKNLQKKIELGYENIDFKISRNKKARRFKKDNRRFFTEKEIKEFYEDIENLNNLEISLSKKIKLEKIIGDTLHNMDGITIGIMYRYNNRFEWHETVYLFKDYLKYVEKLKNKINLFTYNNTKDNYQKLNKDFDLSLEEITLFEDTYDKVYKIFEEDKEYEEKTKVKERREVSNRAKFYIDENGVAISLDQNIDQVIIHR